MRDDDMPLAHIAIAVEGASAASPDIVPLMVANAIIGSYDITFGGGKHLSSRLARLASEESLCHSFQAFHSSYSDTGLLGIYFVTDKHHIDDMMHWSQNAWLVVISNTYTHKHKHGYTPGPTLILSLCNFTYFI